MPILVSSLYGKKVITVGGKVLGNVKEVMLNLENGEVSHLLFVRLETIAKSDNIRAELAKNSVLYNKVKKAADSIIVGNV
ncbi:MAG: PRC-barrel domain-containing protein [Candidatus Micrarchaeaceae archaeon]